MNRPIEVRIAAWKLQEAKTQSARSTRRIEELMPWHSLRVLCVLGAFAVGNFVAKHGD
ncbi:MAG: hypothetical protein ABIO45_13040 [Burkholderiaceae bacterium]